MKFIKSTILFFFILTGLSLAFPTYAATEFISTIRATGGDYSSLSSWEAANQTDLTAATTLVFSHGGIIGTIADGDSVTGLPSGATATVVHVSDTQILLEAISGTFLASEQVQVDGSNYVTISDAGDSAISVAECYNDWPSGLDDSVTVDGWTTDADNYVKVYTPQNERHNGTPGSGFFLAWSSGYSAAIYPNASYTVMDGLEFSLTSNCAGIYSNSLNYATIKNNLIHNQTGKTGTYGIYVYSTENKIYNNTIIGMGTAGIACRWHLADVYNNTIYNSYDGIKTYENYNHNIKNNIVINSSNSDYSLAYSTTEASNNISSDSSAPGSNSQTGVSLADIDFVSTTSGSEDLHIGQDSVAKNTGYDLSSTFTTDIDGQTRDIDGLGWDIGADETNPDFISKIRVNTEPDYDFDTLSGWEDAIESDLTATTSMLFTVSSTGTYDSANDNLDTLTFTGGGTGTLIDINSSGIAYITGVSGTVQTGIVTMTTSSNIFTISNTGAQIGRAVAECYNDWPTTGLDDYVTIDGWTTDADNYVKIYTPQSERHSGKEKIGSDYSGFAMKITTSNILLNNLEDYTTIDGLIFDGSAYASRHVDSSNTFTIANSILTRTGYNGSTTASTNRSAIAFEGVDKTAYLYNIVAYDNAGHGFYGGHGTVYAYNSTFYNNNGYGFTSYYGGSSKSYYNSIATNNNLGDYDNSSASNPNIYYCISGDGTSDDYAGSDNQFDVSSADLDFVSTTSGSEDLHIGSQSVARDAGMDLSSIFKFDIDGYERGLFDVWDIGADEYLESSTRFKGGINIKGGVNIISN